MKTVVRWLLTPTTTKTVVAAGVTAATIAVTLDDLDKETMILAERASFVGLTATFVYGLLSIRPSRGKFRALTSGTLAASAAGLAFMAISAGNAMSPTVAQNK